MTSLGCLIFNMQSLCEVMDAQFDTSLFSHSSAKGRKLTERPLQIECLWSISMLWPFTMTKNSSQQFYQIVFFFFVISKAIICAAVMQLRWSLYTCLSEIRTTITVCLLWWLWKMNTRKPPQLSPLRFVIFQYSCNSNSTRRNSFWVILTAYQCFSRCGKAAPVPLLRLSILQWTIVWVS